MNAPEPGTIKEYLANEEDTVTVGQDLLKLELGGPPKAGEKQQGGQEPKDPATGKQSTSSDPQPQKEEEVSEPGSPPPSPPERKSELPKEESKPGMSSKESSKQKESSPRPQELIKSEPKAKETAPFGNREERRVSFIRSNKHTSRSPL